MSKLDTMEELLVEVKSLQKSVYILDKAYDRLLLHRPLKLFILQFSLGIVRGIGSFLGATIVVAIIVYILHKISFFERLLEAFPILKI